MYEVFDDFCRVPTWYTSHPKDRQRFLAALDQVLTAPGFSADEMGAYIAANHAPPFWPKEPAELKAVIDGLVREAATKLNRQRAASLR